MKEPNLVEEKYNNKDQKVYSPMRTLLKLTFNSKNSKNISLEKRKKLPSSTMLTHKNNQLNKVSSAENININKFNSKIFPQKQPNYPLIDIKDNQIYNYYNSNFNNTFYNINMINDNNTEYNDDDNIFLNLNKNNININNNINTNKTNRYNNINNITTNKFGQIYNDSNNMERKKIKNINQKKKNVTFITNKSKNDFNNTGYLPINLAGPSGVFNYKINKKFKKTNNYIIKNNNNNKQKQEQTSKLSHKKYIQEIEMPFTKKNSDYNNNIENINIMQSNNSQNYIILNKDINSMNNDILNETINPEELYINRYNLGNPNNIISPNQNIIFNINKQNIKKVNNILINTKDMPSNIIYSPKRGLARVHSQENVVNKDIEQINAITENRVIYKNKSVKELNGFTYNKKHNIYKTRNNINSHNSDKKNSLNENISNKYIKKKFSNSCYNSGHENESKNIFSNDDNNLLTNKNENYLDELKYDIEPDIYPEIKINLKNREKKKIINNPNKSVIIENNNRYNFNNYDYEKNNEKIIGKRNDAKKYIYSKNINNSVDENIINNSKNNKKKHNINIMSCNSNRSVIYSNTNLSMSNNTFSENDLLSSKQINYIIHEKSISVKDLYYILIVEEKIKDIAESLILEKIELTRNYCFELINYFYNYNITKCIQSIINSIMDINNIIFFNNYKILAIIILYDLTYNEKILKNVKILVKEIIKLIYSNIILIINFSKNRIKNSEENISILNHIINNLQSKYIHNKELYIDDNEYLLIEQSFHAGCEEKIIYNINFIIRNIHTIINNMKNTKNYNNFLNLFKKIGNITFEELNQFFRNKILKINIVNSSLLSSEIIKKIGQKSTTKINSPYITNPSKKKYSLIISLDDTLVHFKTGSIKNNKGVVQLRPGLSEFFDSIKPYYEIIIFYCGNKKYGDLIINSIDNKNSYIDYRLNRDHCIIFNNDYVKDISKIGRSINKIVIVDNIPQNYRLHKENGIYIKSFYGDNPNDKILFYLSKILINIARNGGDIREGIKKNWNEIINKISSNIYNNYYCK